MRFVWLLVCLTSGCLQPSLVECEDGRSCPNGTVCDDRHQSCASPEQAAACAGRPDLDSCSTLQIVDGKCFGEICLPAGCGNGEREPGELCDDANTVSGDGCSATCVSLERCGDGFVAAMEGEECDDGNTLGQDGCSSGCRLETLVFERIQPVPPPVAITSSAYDVARGRLVVFHTDAGKSATWEWDGEYWFDATRSISPSPRTGPAMAYDPLRRVTVLFGGFGDVAQLNDTWEWDGARWTRRTAARSPRSRSDASMAWDPRLGKLVLFGGVSTLLSFSDTWTWDGENWEELTTAAAPPVRGAAAMVFDTSTDRLLIAGGYVAGLPSTPRFDTWAFANGTWSELVGATLPSGATPEATFDAKRQVVVLASDTTCELENDRWVARGPSPGPNGQLEYVPALERVVRWGGSVAGNPYEWDGATWSERPQSAWPGARRNATAVSDPLRGTVLMFGGVGAATTPLWEWNGRRWTQIATTLASRTNASIAYDASAREIILFGGTSTANGREGDTYRWTGDWSIASTTGPTPRTGAAMTYDAARKKVVLFGGDTATGTNDETWEWNGTAWSQLSPPVSPPPRSLTALAYDSARQRVVMFGGRSGTGMFLDDTWEWDGAAWTQILSSPTPLGRQAQATVFDRARKRTLMFGGTISEFAIWEWNGLEWSQPLLEWQVGIANGPAAAYDPVSRQMVVFGGGVGTGVNDGMYLVHYTSGQTELCDRNDLDRDTLVGCDDSDCAGRCTPECSTSPCDPTLPHCGDGTCSVIEDVESCPDDC